MRYKGTATFGRYKGTATFGRHSCFPADFMFQLNAEEAGSLRSQIVTLKGGRGTHRKYLAYVFTEQGIAMLSSVLRS